MAYSPDTKNAAKIAYVRDRLPLSQIARNLSVPIATVSRWKDAAAKKGDDWEQLRAAVVIAGGDVNNMAQQVIVEMMIQFSSVLNLLKTDEKMDAVKRAQTLASVTSSLTQAMAFMSRAMPEESRLATGMLVLEKLAEHIRNERPQYLAAFADILADFGNRLPAILRDGK